MPVVDSVAFLARYAEFSAFPTPKIDLALTDAEDDTSSAVFGTLHARAISALAAHRLAISSDEDGNPIADQPGMLAAATADGVSSTYQVPEHLSSQDLALYGTAYGQSFLEIRNRCIGGPTVAC